MINDNVVLGTNSDEQKATLKFLQDIRLLRQHKGKYLTYPFCDLLAAFANRISKSLECNNGYKDRLLYFPEKISDSLVALCLESMELELQRISETSANIDADSGISKISCVREKDFKKDNILIEVAEDAHQLVRCIKFTLESNVLCV